MHKVETLCSSKGPIREGPYLIPRSIESCQADRIGEGRLSWSLPYSDRAMNMLVYLCSTIKKEA